MHNRLVRSLTAAESAEIIDMLRQEIPATVEDAVQQIEKQFPRYRQIVNPEHADFLPVTVERSILGFIEILVDKDTPLTETLAFFRHTGTIETQIGLSLEVSQAAFRLGAAISITRLTAAAERHHRVDATVIAQVAAAVMDYLNRVAEAVSQGHRTGKAMAVLSQRAARARLVEAIVDPRSSAGGVKEHADECHWQIPDRVSVVAVELPAQGRWPALALPPEILNGLHLTTPCLVVPDAEGPGRRRTLENGLRGWVAALGPAVPLAEAATSLTYARQALDLAAEGALPADALINTSDHLPMMILAGNAFLTRELITRRLGPLLEDKPDKHARRLAETFLAALDHGFVATSIAAALDVHPQTIRYRLRKLEAMFGEALLDPANRLEFHMALHAWLATV